MGDFLNYIFHTGDLKNENYQTYENFYNNASKWGFPVKMCRFEQKHVFERAMKKLQEQGPILNAWSSFAPEVEWC